jgi:hypothetical protein
MTRRLSHYDTTLRDTSRLGLQQQIALATELVRAGAAVIALPADLGQAKAIALQVHGAAVAIQARPVRVEVDRAFLAVAGAERPLLEIQVSTLLSYKRPLEVIGAARDAIIQAVELGAEVALVAENGFRSDRQFLTHLLTVGARAGATHLILPDSFGDATPQEHFELIRHLIEHVDGPAGITFGVECQSRLGLSLANLLAAIDAGVSELAVTVEAPLVALDQILRQRPERFDAVLAIDLELLAAATSLLIPYPASDVVEICSLDSFQVVSGNQAVPTATVRLNWLGSEVRQEAASGRGPVDALYTAINRAAGVSAALLDYQLRAVSGGAMALGEAVVQVQVADRVATGRGRSEDVIEASAIAYMHALNQILSGTTLKVSEEPAPGWQMRAWGD